MGLEEAEKAMDDVLAEFMEEGVDPEHLKRIKAQIRADQIYARDDADRVAHRYGSALAIGLTVEDVQAWPDVLQSVTEEDIMEAARGLFDKDRSVTGWLMKEDAQ